MTSTILGINKGVTASGKPLRDGGAALIRDGKLLGAIAEERLSRTKHAGGSALAAQSLLQHFNVRPSEVDVVVVSTCCEAEDVGDVGRQFQNSEILSCNHHLSHGYGSFIPSEYAQAIVAVLDGGGNVASAGPCEQWWTRHRDQQTYFLGHGQELEVLERDFHDPGEAGMGEIYRAFTYFLGWDSSRKAGNVMSLAAYGNPQALPKESLIWLDADGHMRSSVHCTPKDPCGMVTSLLRQVGYDLAPRRLGEAITQLHCNVAAWVQSEVESALLAKITWLVKRTGVRKVCLAGGVAYNCRAVGRLARSGIVEHLYVGPAAGDQGQCIGNAIYGAIHRKASLKLGRLSPYLGFPYRIQVRDIIDAAAAEHGQQS